MKKCSKCGYENSNRVSVCEKCYGVLDNTIIEETSEEFFQKLERKERVIKFTNYALLFIYFIVVAPLFIVSANAMGSLGAGLIFFFLLFVLIPVLFYASIFHPDALFELTYMNVISNISDAQPSDWFYITTKWTAYLFLGIGIVMIAKIYFTVI